jgi:hypothetical protein
MPIKNGNIKKQWHIKNHLYFEQFLGPSVTKILSRANMTKAKHITAFRIITGAGVDVSPSRFYELIKRLFHPPILQPPAQFRTL